MSRLEEVFFYSVDLRLLLVHHLTRGMSRKVLKSFFSFAAVCRASFLLLGGPATCKVVAGSRGGVDVIRFDFLMALSSPDAAMRVLRTCFRMGRLQQLGYTDILACNTLDPLPLEAVHR